MGCHKLNAFCKPCTSQDEPAARSPACKRRVEPEQPTACHSFSASGTHSPDFTLHSLRPLNGLDCPIMTVIQTLTDTVNGGRAGEAASTGLTEALTDLGFTTERLKTGTPARVDARTVDTRGLEPQPGDEDVRWFSFDHKVQACAHSRPSTQPSGRCCRGSCSLGWSSFCLMEAAGHVFALVLAIARSCVND